MTLKCSEISNGLRISARIGRDPMTVSRIWNQCVQDGIMERRAGFQRTPITSSQEDRDITHMALIDRAATSRALSRELGPFLPLMMHHRQKCLRWCDQQRTCAHEWRDVIFSDDSRFCLQLQDGHIHVWRHRDERTLSACIHHRPTGHNQP
ncbi:transposable element Tcb1 transposase [Trichonephila clavipes]|nr:transposable element Tcb1 transposase [Trichonephila clavipes]